MATQPPASPSGIRAGFGAWSYNRRNDEDGPRTTLDRRRAWEQPAALPFLTEYLDLSITVRADESALAIREAEVLRLQRLVAVFRAAAAHPRRLGGDAMPDELSLDKKRAKRLAYAAEQSLRGWGGEPVEWEEAHKIAATIDFLTWWEEHERRTRARQRYIATWCHRYGDNNGDARWCKSAVVRLNNEIKWFAHALR